MINQLINAMKYIIGNQLLVYSSMKIINTEHQPHIDLKS